jgi:hypothetical protein
VYYTRRRVASNNFSLFFAAKIVTSQLTLHIPTLREREFLYGQTIIHNFIHFFESRPSRTGRGEGGYDYV